MYIFSAGWYAFRAPYCHGKRPVCLSVCPSFHLSVILRYRDHIGWKSPKIISLLVSQWCSLSADAKITDLFQREHPKILTQVMWPTPCRFECRRYSMANFGQMVRDSAVITMGAYRKPSSLFSVVRSVTPDGHPFLKNGVQNAPSWYYVELWIAISPQRLIWSTSCSVLCSVFRLGGLNGAISGSIKSRMTAGRHLWKSQQHRAVSLRQHCFLILNYCFVLLDFIFVY